jgi:transposase
MIRKPIDRPCASVALLLVIAKRNTPDGSGLGVHRWVVEQTIAWLHQCRRLRIRYERRPEIHEAFLSLGCILICSWFV